MSGKAGKKRTEKTMKICKDKHPEIVFNSDIECPLCFLGYAMRKLESYNLSLEQRIENLEEELNRERNKEVKQ